MREDNKEGECPGHNGTGPLEGKRLEKYDVNMQRWSNKSVLRLLATSVQGKLNTTLRRLSPPFIQPTVPSILNLKIGIETESFVGKFRKMRTESACFGMTNGRLR